VLVNSLAIESEHALSRVSIRPYLLIPELAPVSGNKRHCMGLGAALRFCLPHS
jgi:hypothetical protein